MAWSPLVQFPLAQSPLSQLSTSAFSTGVVSTSLVSTSAVCTSAVSTSAFSTSTLSTSVVSNNTFCFLFLQMMKTCLQFLMILNLCQSKVLPRIAKMTKAVLLGTYQILNTVLFIILYTYRIINNTVDCKV